MAYKARGKFNMSAEIRTLLTGNPTLTAREVEELLIAKFPNQKINSTSCAFTFSNARKQIELRPGGSIPIHPDLVPLLIAKNLVEHCGGDFDRAVSVVKQLADLQNEKA
jgi:hypothetical protein